MSATIFVLDRQARGRVFTFGSNAASNEALLTIENGTQAASNVVLDVKGSQNIAGDLNLVGNLNITGSINESTVNNLNVIDYSITLNKGGTTPLDDTSGIIIEGTAAAVKGAIFYKAASATKFSIGDGSSQVDIVGTTSNQTLTTKTINASNNTITDTSAAQGDLFVFQSTKFVRFARGSASQQLRTNAAGTDIEWFTATSGSTTKATVVSGTQDSANKSFSIANAVTASSEMIFLNGQLLTPGVSNDYVLSGTTLTFQAGFTAPASTDVIRAYGAY